MRTFNPEESVPELDSPSRATGTGGYLACLLITAMNGRIQNASLMKEKQCDILLGGRKVRVIRPFRAARSCRNDASRGPLIDTLIAFRSRPKGEHDMSDIQCIRCQNNRGHMISFAFYYALPIDAEEWKLSMSNRGTKCLAQMLDGDQCSCLDARGKEDLLLLSKTIWLVDLYSDKVRVSLLSFRVGR